jgi:hypothetical protein
MGGEAFRGEATAAAETERVLLAVDIAIAGILEESEINRVVMGVASGPAPGHIFEQSKALWAMALGARCRRWYDRSPQGADTAAPASATRFRFSWRAVLLDLW